MEDPLGDLSSDSLMSSPKSLIDTISVMEEELERLVVLKHFPLSFPSFT